MTYSLEPVNLHLYGKTRTSLIAQLLKKPQETPVQFLVPEDLLEKG